MLIIIILACYSVMINILPQSFPKCPFRIIALSDKPVDLQRKPLCQAVENVFLYEFKQIFFCFQLLLLVCLAALSHAGLVSPVYNAPYAYGGWNPYSSYPAQPAIASQHSNILRSPFNLGQVTILCYTYFYVDFFLFN